MLILYTKMSYSKKNRLSSNLFTIIVDAPHNKLIFHAGLSYVTIISLSLSRNFKSVDKHTIQVN